MHTQHTQIKLVDPILYLVFLIHDLLRRKKVAVYQNQILQLYLSI